MTTTSARAVFAIRDFRLFLATRFLAGLAQMMVTVAVGWLVYDLTHDPLHLGYVGLAQFLPAFALTLVGGQVADRFARRRILMACVVVSVLAVSALLQIARDPTADVRLIYGVMAVMGAVRAFFAPAAQSLAPQLVGPVLLPRALALGSTAWQASVIVGPALGGLLYGIAPPVVFAVAAVLLLLALGAVSLIRPAPAMTARLPGGFFEGVKFVRSRPEILGAISLDLFAVLLGGATALLPVYARDILHTGPLGLGLLRSAPALGATMMAVLLAHRPVERAAGIKLFVAVAMFGLATLAFGLSTDFPLSLAALVVLGGADMISVVLRQTLVQLNTPDEMRGRVSAVNLVFIGASNELGEFESGVTAAWFGTVPAVVVGGLGTLAVAAIWAWRFPALRRFDQLR